MCCFYSADDDLQVSKSNASIHRHFDIVTNGNLESKRNARGATSLVFLCVLGRIAFAFATMFAPQVIYVVFAVRSLCLHKLRMLRSSFRLTFSCTFRLGPYVVVSGTHVLRFGFRFEASVGSIFFRQALDFLESFFCKCLNNISGG